MSLYNITYLSSVFPELTREELLELLHKNKTRNEAAGVTGIMVYDEGDILQVLEGEERSVLRAFQRIEREGGHGRIVPIFREPIGHREFEDWSLAFRDSELHADDVDGYSEVLNDGEPDYRLPMAPSKVKTFLLSFLRPRVESAPFRLAASAGV